MTRKLNAQTGNQRLNISFNTDDKETHSFFADHPAVLDMAIKAFVKSLRDQLEAHDIPGVYESEAKQYL